MKKLELFYHIAHLLIWQLIAFFMYAIIQSNLDEPSAPYGYFLLGGLLAYLLTMLLNYLKSELEFLALKRWSDGPKDKTERKGDAIIIEVDQLNVMVSYTNNFFRKILSIYLIDLAPKTEVSLQLEKPYLLGVNYDTKTASVGKKLVVRRLPTKTDLRGIVEELKAKAIEWNLSFT